MGEPAPTPRRDPFEVLGVPVDPLTVAGAIDLVEKKALSGEGGYGVFCTVSSVLSALDDQDVLTAMREADMVAPDGMPLVWIANRSGRAVERVYGPDFMIDLMSRTGGRLSHYFFGGGPGVTDELVARLKARFPELDVAGHHEPPFGIGIDDATSDVDRIVRSGANVIWVGLGHPKQELWMRRHRDRFAGMLLGVGAAFDFHSGRKKEAPRWMKRAGLQWLHRLVKEPRRLWRRYFVGNTRFLWLLVRSRGSKTLR